MRVGHGGGRHLPAPARFVASLAIYDNFVFHPRGWAVLSGQMRAIGLRSGRIQDDVWWVATDVAVGTQCAWDKCLFDAAFWKLRELGARYELPDVWTARVGAERASLALSMRNVLTLWQAQKRIHGHVVSDPELGNPTDRRAGPVDAPT